MKSLIVFLWMAMLNMAAAMDAKEFESLESSRAATWVTGKKLFGPGFGWDYLTGSVNGYPLINISYSIGQTTNDELFLVPDCFVVEDRKFVNFMDLAEVIESSMDYTDITASSMSISASASASFLGASVSMSASYSQSFQHMINEQTKSRSVTLRTQYADHRYTLMMNSDCPLNKGFESFILEIASCIKNNDEEWAYYLAQELVRDYGTHFIKKASLGGIFYTEDYVSSSYWFKSENTYSDMKIHASMQFSYGFFSAGGSYDQFEMRNKTKQQEYAKNVNLSKAQTIGGNYKPGHKVEQWADTLDNNLAIIDKEADLISSFITYANFESIERVYLAKTRQLIDKTINEYLIVNKINGCLNRRSVNYQPFSNFHVPELCKEDFIFGAFYELRQECTLSCQGLKNFTVKNILTSDTTCPQGHLEIRHLFNKPNIELYTFTECKGGPGLEKSPILFGGIYSTDLEDNPVTGAKTCPPGFKDYPILQDNAKICLSRNFEDGIAYAIPFGGFLSTCDVNKINDLKCPVIYEKRFVGNYNGCFMYYCSRIKATEPRVIKKPPYTEMPERNYRIGKSKK